MNRAISASFSAMIWRNDAFERPWCMLSKFWHIKWLRIFYVRILHNLCKKCTFRHFGILNCCLWLYFVFYVTYEWREVFWILQRVFKHPINTSRAHLDIHLITSHFIYAIIAFVWVLHNYVCIPHKYKNLTFEISYPSECWYNNMIFKDGKYARPHQ